jgi:hypothetical protein
MALQSFVGPWPLFSFLILYTVSRTPWTGDQSVARPLPTHRTTQTEKTHTGIHAVSGIRTYDPSVRASEDSSCFGPRGHRDRQGYNQKIYFIWGKFAFLYVPWAHFVSGIFARLMGVEARDVVMRGRTSINTSIHQTPLNHSFPNGYVSTFRYKLDHGRNTFLSNTLRAEYLE